MKRILVALDSSPRASSVLEAAARIAIALHGCKLVLFHSVGLPPELPDSVLGYVDGNLSDILAKKARNELDALAATVPTNIIERVEVLIGVPWQAICREATERDVDLIVIGSHGYGVLDRFLGTTAAKIVNHADRSVLVVRPPVHPETSAAGAR
jgi:nucleotide-binding universal stress UspA family protein